MSYNVTDRSNLLAPEKPRRRGCLGWVLLIIFFPAAFAICFVLGPVISLFTGQMALVPGEASQFDPVARFEEIYNFAGKDYQFYTLEAEYVRSDGTLDLYADYEPEVTYSFVKELGQSGAARPIGAGGNAEGRQWETVEVEVSRPFEMVSTSRGSSTSTTLKLGMERDTSLPQDSNPGALVPPPTCSFKALWDIAISQDAPREAVAIIRYDADGYNFRIEGLSTDLNFDMNCKLIEA